MDKLGHYQLVIFDWEGTLKSLHALRVELNPGALQLLQQLKRINCLIAIATGCSTRGLKYDLHKLGLESWFDATRTAEQTYNKPHPLMIEELLLELNCDKASCLVIGDNPCDIEMAKAAGCDGIGVDFGSVKTHELLQAGAKAVINDFADLFKVV